MHDRQSARRSLMNSYVLHAATESTGLNPDVLAPGSPHGPVVVFVLGLPPGVTGSDVRARAAILAQAAGCLGAELKTVRAESGADFGGFLRRLRAAAGLSQEALAERAGLSAKAISALECGMRRKPYRATVEALANALALSTDERPLFRAAAVTVGESVGVVGGDGTGAVRQ
jgi:DNA-binding XRE family transcriptional regulator